jgi:hypothetical protein
MISAMITIFVILMIAGMAVEVCLFLVAFVLLWIYKIMISVAVMYICALLIFVTWHDLRMRMRRSRYFEATGSVLK